ncbi:MAG: response regulator [Treponema sp.]|jgi:putative two-component system response regulator|nr:response regulator [Treponema sp.]
MQKLIFIVDDNDANLTVAACALEGEYRVLTMPSAQKMFSLLEKKKPDLILLDVQMPEISGLEAAARLKENRQWKDIPVLFLTGFRDEKLLSAAENCGVLDVIDKPFKPSELLESVKKYAETG